MTKYFIKSISIEGFRGINNRGTPLLINFQTDGVTSIFGENGKGKSSIFEAFLFLILGRIIRFDDYHGDIKDKRTIKNLFHSGDGNIKIEFIDDSNGITDINVKINENGERLISSTSIPRPETFLVSLCSKLNFLDYKSFEKIILNSSEETGKLFSNLVGFGGFINIKDKFDKISRTQNINTDFGKAIKEGTNRSNNIKISELKIEIQKRLKEIGVKIDINDKNEILNVINAFLKKQYSEKLKSIIDSSQIDFDHLIKTKIGSEYEKNASKLTTQQEALKEIILLQKGINTFNNKTVTSLTDKLKIAYSLIATQNDIVLGKLYDDAIKSYDTIDGFNKNTCILCNTEDLGAGRNTFYEQINAKIKSYIKFKNKYTSFLNEFMQKIHSSRLLEIENQFLTEFERFFSNIEKNKDYLTYDFFETHNVGDIITTYKAKVKVEINQIHASIKELKSLIPSKISELVEINNAYKFVFNSIIEINKLSRDNDYNTKYLAELENWTTFTNKVKDDYEDAYNTLMDEIASMIDTDTKLFFKEIMGDVDIIPKLKKENKGQKINILLEKFYSNTTDIKAAPLLSESYRNALSLSIYFAAALKSRSAGSFIVVDDITSSFDSGHQLFLLDLIKSKISISPSNKKGKQIIFLTHDGFLKKPLNEASNQKNWTHYSLNYNKDFTSLKPITSNDLRNNLIRKISNNEYDNSDLRIYYESVLLEIIEKLNLEIPYSLINSHDEKMVNNLILAISEIIEMKTTSKKIKKGLRLPTKQDFKSHIQQLCNNLSHWSSAREASISTTALNRIVLDIDSFKQKFQYNCTCSKNAGWVYYKSLKTPRHKDCNCNV